jgi:hypothetical protein
MTWQVPSNYKSLVGSNNGEMNEAQRSKFVEGNDC